MNLLKKILKGIGWGLCFALFASAQSQDVYDFEFRDMDFKKAVEAIADLDKKNVVFSQAITSKPISLSLNKVSPSFALRIILDNYGYVIVEKGDVLHVMTPSERGPAATPTVVFPLTNVVAKDLENNIKSFLGATGKVSINEQSNSIIVAASADELKQVRALIEELDQQSNQVYIEAKIIETSTKFARNFGVRWGIDGGRMADLNATGVDTALTGNLSTGLIGSARLSMQLQAGERNGDLKVVSSPNVATLNGIPAIIESLTTFSIRTLASTETTAGLPQNIGGLEQVRAGVTLRVTPYIVSQSQVRMNIELSKSEADFSRTVDGIPGISDNSAKTSLVVHSGQTATIGGLVYQNKSNADFGTPFLAHIPILGFLFGSQEKKAEDREMMIFITPTVFRGQRKNQKPVPEIMLSPSDILSPTSSLDPALISPPPATPTEPLVEERRPAVQIHQPPEGYGHLYETNDGKKAKGKVVLDGKPKLMEEELTASKPSVEEKGQTLDKSLETMVK